MNSVKTFVSAIFNAHLNLVLDLVLGEAEDLPAYDSLG